MKQKESQPKRNFKTMLKSNGYSSKSVEELCKWYYPSEENGVASY